MTNETSGISRRTLAKGAAWAVPAVAVAAATPAMAASYYVTIEQAGPACKLPGASCERETGIKFGYTQPVLVCTNVPADVTITFPSPQYILINGVSRPYSVVTGPASGNNPPIEELEIPYTGTAVRCATVNIYLNTTDSAESTLDGTLLYNWTSPIEGENGSGSAKLYSANTPPCVDCAPPTVTPTQAPASTTTETVATDGAATRTADASSVDVGSAEPTVSASPEPTVAASPEPSVAASPETVG